MVAAAVIVLLAATFIALGRWQLDRHEERQEANSIVEQRMGEEPVSLSDALATADGDLASIEYRRVRVTGEFDSLEEVLIRSQVELGQAGFHVITPLLTPGGEAVLVNRGWVPLDMDTPPVAATPPEGNHEVEGWIQLSQSRPLLGREDPPGQLDVLNRVDIDRIEEQSSRDLTPIYLVMVGERGSELPLPSRPPDFDDEGAHFSYAMQWFGFAAVGLVGFYFLLRRQSGQST